MEIPVYFFSGFLEAGKTRFIQETMEDEKFNAGEKTLILLCEEGIEEYDPSTFAASNVYIEPIEREDSLSAELLEGLRRKHNAERVVVEYNGMWQIASFYNAMPEGWIVYQNVMFADSQTFVNYNANMRSLVADKLNACELVAFTRMTDTTDRETLHKIVRTVNRRSDIVYQFDDGRAEYDEIEDPLPFDINANPIVIEDVDFAIWYSDLTNEPQKYNGKTVAFKGVVARDRRIPKNSFVVGRHVMTCCAADIQYNGLVCIWDDNAAERLKNYDWVYVTARVKVERNKVYRSEGPVLYADTVESAKKPDQPVATFY